MEVGSRQCKFNLIVIFMCKANHFFFFLFFVPFWFKGKLIVDIRDQSFHIYVANIVIFILILIRSIFFLFIRFYLTAKSLQTYYVVWLLSSLSACTQWFPCDNICSSPEYLTQRFLPQNKCWDWFELL